MAERPTRRGARSRRCHRTAEENQPAAAAADARSCFLERRARRQTSPFGAGAAVSQVSAADREYFGLDRERTLVYQQRQAGNQTTRLPARRLRRGQTGAMAKKASEEEPHACGYGRPK